MNSVCHHVGIGLSLSQKLSSPFGMLHVAAALKLAQSLTYLFMSGSNCPRLLYRMILTLQPHSAPVEVVWHETQSFDQPFDFG